MKYIAISVATAALIALSAPASADLTLPTPDSKEIFDNHDNPAPQPCHPALSNEAYVKSNFHGWGPWGATNEVRQALGTRGTPIEYSNMEPPGEWSCLAP